MEPATNVQWVQVSETAESWHIVKDILESRGGFEIAETLCGLNIAKPDVHEERVGHDKTCETCLRIGGPR